MQEKKPPLTFLLKHFCLIGNYHIGVFIALGDAKLTYFRVLADKLYSETKRFLENHVSQEYAKVRKNNFGFSLYYKNL